MDLCSALAGSATRPLSSPLGRKADIPLLADLEYVWVDAIKENLGELIWITKLGTNDGSSMEGSSNLGHDDVADHVDW